jgi:L-cystine transport system permease protein
MTPFDISYVWYYLPRLLPFIPVTLKVWILSILCGLILGVLFAIIRMKHIPILAQFVRVIMSIVRGVPPVTQLFLFYYGLPMLLAQVGIDLSDLDGIWFVVFAYGISQGVAVSENLRASFASVGKGQLEAAYSIGMTSPASYFRIMIPQALVVALPNFANLCMSTLKSTSLAFSVGVVELMTKASQMAATKQHLMESYISLAIVYYALYLVIKFVFDRVEHRIAFENAG